MSGIFQEFTLAATAPHPAQVRSTPLAAIRAGRPQAWRPLFESEVLSFPGYVEFDDVSIVAVTYSAHAG